MLTHVGEPARDRFLGTPAERGGLGPCHGSNERAGRSRVRTGSRQACAQWERADELHQFYALEGFHARLTASPHAKQFVLKGGVNGPGPR